MKTRMIAWMLLVLILLLPSCTANVETTDVKTTVTQTESFETEQDQSTAATESGETESVVLTEEPSESIETPSESTLTPSASPTYGEVPTEYKNINDPGFHCAQAFVYDLQKDCFIYLSGEKEIIYPASTTKLLTILYARTLLPLDLVVAPGNELELVGKNSSKAYIYENHRLTVEQLIEGMLLPSGNDAAHVLAAAGGRAIKPDCKDGKEAVSVFMKGMNDYAAKIGLTGSVFINPDGYDNDAHYSTLHDMAIVAKLAYRDEIIRKYCNLPSDKVTYASGHWIEWTNTNWCIDPYSPEHYVPEMNGMKTGSVNDHYYCFIGSAEIEGKSFVFGFFGEEYMTNRFLDAKIAVQWIKDWCWSK